MPCYLNCTMQVVRMINRVELMDYNIICFSVHDCYSGLIVLIIANIWEIF